MKMGVLILVDSTAHFGKGIEAVLPKLRATDAALDCPDDRVGRMKIGIAGTAGHIGEE